MLLPLLKIWRANLWFSSCSRRRSWPLKWHTCIHTDLSMFEPKEDNVVCPSVSICLENFRTNNFFLCSECVLNLSLGCRLFLCSFASTDQQFPALVYRWKGKLTLSIVRCGMLIRSDATYRTGAISCICKLFIEKELRIMSKQMRFSWLLMLMWRVSRLLVSFWLFPLN